MIFISQFSHLYFPLILLKIFSSRFLRMRRERKWEFCPFSWAKVAIYLVWRPAKQEDFCLSREKKTNLRPHRIKLI